MAMNVPFFGSGRSPSGHHVPRAWLFALLLATVCCAAGRPRLAHAHAVLVRSEPAQNARLTAPPSQVALFFSEPLNHRLSTVTVRDVGGRRQDDGAMRPGDDPKGMALDLPALGPGLYTVNWTTVSAADGHRLSGSFPFTVLAADGSAPAGDAAQPPATVDAAAAVQPIDSTSRWLLLLGLIAVVGSFGFVGLVIYPASARLAEGEREATRRLALDGLARTAPIGALLAVAADVGSLLYQGQQNGSALGGGSLIPDRLGVYWLVRQALVLLTAGLALLMRRHKQRLTLGGAEPLLLCGLGLGLGSLLTLSLTSHAAAGAGAAWAIPGDFLHLVGVSLWLGGLVQLPLLLRYRRRTAEGTRLVGLALQRFSGLAVGCVALVLLTGTFAALNQLPGWSALIETAYGRTLLVKLGLVAGVLLLGLWNGTRVARRCEHLALAAEPATAHAATRLAWTATAESVVAALAVAATAVLVTLIPAKDAQRVAANADSPPLSDYARQVRAGDLTASLTVAPTLVGENRFTVMLDGPDVDKVQRVQLRFQPHGPAVGASAVEAVAAAGMPGMYSVDAANLSFGGSWQVAVNVRRRDHDDVNGVFAVAVPMPMDAMDEATPPTSVTAFPAHGITPLEAAGAVLLTVAGLAVFVRRRAWLTRSGSG